MKKSDKHREITDERLKRYLANDMSEAERHLFEKEMEGDPFLADAVEGMSHYPPDELSADIEQLAGSLPSGRSHRGTLIYRIAAAAVILLAISSLLLVKELRRPDMLVSGDTAREYIADSVPGYVPQEPSTETAVQPADKTVETVAGAEDRSTVTGAGQDLAAVPEKVTVEPDLEFVEHDLQTKELTEEMAVMKTEERVDTTRVAEEVVVSQVAGVAQSRTKEAVRQELAAEQAKEVVAQPVRAADTPVASKRKTAEPVAMVAENTISGRVLDGGDSLPLPGVTIVVKGSTRGVTTDIDGRFTLAADSGEVLVASFIGMQSTELPVTAGYTDIVLEPDLMALDEVVVMGYGVQGKVSGVQTTSVTEVRLDEEQPLFRAPEPVGGMKILRDYMTAEQRWPQEWTSSTREVVRIKFDVMATGSITNIEIVRSPDESFSNEAKRLVLNGPSWNPATVDEVPYTESVSLRIVFRKR